ncbi:MAG TPA: hypothetical protein VEZ88_13300 [Steroidobacteraceae bacterium]|nr:hypothetical protein [Steroidobacteraceae bacterium]
MVFKGREVVANLVRKGFRLDNRSHKFLYFYYEGRHAGPYTYASHGKPSDDVGHDNVKKMKKQLALDTNQQVHELVDCTMTEAAYVEILKKKRKLPPGR